MAEKSMNRTSIKVGLARPEIIDSPYQALRFPNANGDDIYIYPGFVMTQSKTSDFALIDIREIRAALHRTSFIEEEPVPPDAEIIGQTWKKTNKDGSPDRRFAENYSIPVTKYGELWLSSPTGLNEAFMFSNFAKAESFASALNNYQRRVQELARQASSTPLLDLMPAAENPYR
jgi:hypothetical protein